MPWLTAIALMLVLESVMPLFFPAHWKAMFRQILGLSDGQIRFLGLATLGAGVALLLVTRMF
jgi:uncharacterized protein